MELDAFDRAIVAALQKDGRMSIAQLAETVALSPTPVSRRLKRLEEDGLITGYAALLDGRMLDLALEAYVQVNLERHEDEIIAHFEAEIAANPHIITCHAVTGDMDYLLHVVARDVDHLSQITLKTLLRIRGVRDVKSVIALEEVKRTRALPLQ
ncbi:Lrp/AsnC family transcriptional regulator [Croceicoccus sp. YJ47]|uniref:Lrp/AsnC family transcriptional regulator n=1 Tax=Croceicoccus sp. YJ47 TaxID=2798724 RepID=UPI00192371B6|nr:Lrp/AsnC family transcriptional regulator [Croceicoccus sp. YJ47]QQN73007.1 Lrp/AsnC family transcriptional regulator [Croceicoccus sp. YJ47]